MRLRHGSKEPGSDIAAGTGFGRVELGYGASEPDLVVAGCTHSMPLGHVCACFMMSFMSAYAWTPSDPGTHYVFMISFISFLSRSHCLWLLFCAVFSDARL